MYCVYIMYMYILYIEPSTRLHIHVHVHVLTRLEVLALTTCAHVNVWTYILVFSVSHMSVVHSVILVPSLVPRLLPMGRSLGTRLHSVVCALCYMLALH